MINIFIALVLFSFSASHADIPLREWTTLNYQAPEECFKTGIKRVFVPFPGFGTWACIKDAIRMLPQYEKSGQLVAGHAVGLVGASVATITLLVIAAHVDVPYAKDILGPYLVRWFVKPLVMSCKDV